MVGRCTHRAIEQLFGFGGLADVPCAYRILDQSPDWLLE